MRLIDADALKKCAIPCEIHTGALTELCVPLYQIDNAPTVEPEITNDDLQAAMTETYHLGYELAETKFKRPTGEWITRTEDNGVNYRFYCSYCKREVIQITDYCPYCGAYMKGGTNAENDLHNPGP